MWQDIHGHDDVVEQFRASLRAGRLASTYLFVGPPGVGKRSFALQLAAALLCQNHADEDLRACGECPSCKFAAAGTHPDLVQVGRPAGKSFIPIDTFLGPPDKRMRAGLCHDIALKPFLGGRKVAIIDDADYLNNEGANCLLKTLEEPPPRSVLILIGTSAARQLPTIRSRCQLIRFRPLADEVLIELLLSQGHAATRSDAERLATLSEGSLERAVELADPELGAFRGRLFHALAASPPDSVRLAQTVSTLVDEAGKDAAPRRDRLRQVIGFAADFYRQAMRLASGANGSADQELLAAAERALQSGKLDAFAAAAALDRCLQALEHIERNANQTTLIECWLDDLEQIAQSGQPLLRG